MDDPVGYLIRLPSMFHVTIENTLIELNWLHKSRCATGF